MEPIRVLLADDHPVLRVGLRALLEQEPDIVVVGEASSGEEALTRVASLRPDVVVLDCQMPDRSGPEVARQMRQRGLSGRVLALSAYQTDAYIREMLEAGAAGYLLKEEAPEVIVRAIREVARGGEYFSPAVAAKAAAWARGERPGGLTERELEVLRCMAEGLSNKEIAARLHMTERTVAFHVSNILQKLGVASRVEAVVWAKDRGIVR